MGGERKKKSTGLMRIVINQPPPPFKKNNIKTKYDPKEEASPFEMNDWMYEQVKEWRERGFTIKRINSTFPGQDRLYQQYKKYHEEYLRIQKQKEKQKILDDLNKIARGMEETINVITKIEEIIKNNKKKGKRKSESEYKKFFDILDSGIELITNMIYVGFSPLQIVQNLKIKGLTPIIYHYWVEETELIEKIKFAYRVSGEQHMHDAKIFLMDWLDKEKHPELDMQHVGLVREVALWKQRYAEYMDRKKWGKKIEIIDERPQQKVVDGKYLDKFLSGLNEAFESKVDDEKEEEKEEEDFTEFEEV